MRPDAPPQEPNRGRPGSRPSGRKAGT
ncbi:rCG20918, isoform CRA_b [Rattus norvegicus]|uniref:RCG20918, isoform CRA_b n=1 Tax=Rattus norvegicus TaxID=10116 RepID=A6JE64_RAT|nr:rCG20918, isoform CRA_b [Rattus norvegicus]